MAWNTLLGWVSILVLVWVSILVLVLGISMWAYAKCRGAFEVRSRRRHYLFLIIPGRTVTRELISGVSSELPLSFTKDRKLSYDLCPRAHDYTYYSINSGTRYFSATKDTAALVINLVAEIERMQSKQVLCLIVVPAFRFAYRFLSYIKLFFVLNPVHTVAPRVSGSGNETFSHCRYVGMIKDGVNTTDVDLNGHSHQKREIVTSTACVPGSASATEATGVQISRNKT